MSQSDVIKSLSQLTSRTDLPADVRAVLDQTISKAASPLQYDLWIYRAVVIVLDLTVIATVFGGLFLALKADANIKLPDAIVAIGSAAVGALAGLLAPPPQREGS